MLHVVVSNTIDEHLCPLVLFGEVRVDFLFNFLCCGFSFVLSSFCVLSSMFYVSILYRHVVKKMIIVEPLHRKKYCRHAGRFTDNINLLSLCILCAHIYKQYFFTQKINALYFELWSTIWFHVVFCISSLNKNTTYLNYNIFFWFSRLERLLVLFYWTVSVF